MSIVSSTCATSTSARRPAGAPTRMILSAPVRRDAGDQGPDRPRPLHHRGPRAVADPRPRRPPCIERSTAVRALVRGSRSTAARGHVGGDFDHLQVVVPRQVHHGGEAGPRHLAPATIGVGQGLAPDAGLRVAQHRAEVAPPAAARFTHTRSPTARGCPVTSARGARSPSSATVPVHSCPRNMGYVIRAWASGVACTQCTSEPQTQRSTVTRRSPGPRGWRSYSWIDTTPGLSRRAPGTVPLPPPSPVPPAQPHVPRPTSHVGVLVGDYLVS